MKIPKYICVKKAAKLLGVSEEWLLAHLNEFPHTIRLPDAGPLPNDGIRLSQSDIQKWNSEIDLAE
jgi:hypothetical protein